MVNWDVAASAYNSLPTPEILVDGTENHWCVVVHRTGPGRGRIHFLQKSTSRAQVPDGTDAELPEDGTLGLARIIVVRMIFHFLMPGVRVSGADVGLVLRSGTFAPRVLEAPTLAFGSVVRAVLDEVGITTTQVVTLGDAVAGLAARGAGAGQWPEWWDVPLEGQLESSGAQANSLSAQADVQPEPSGAQAVEQLEPSSAQTEEQLEPSSAQADAPPTSWSFDNVTEWAGDSNQAVTEMNMRMINLPLVTTETRTRAVNQMLAYSFRAPELPPRAQEEINELFRVLPSDPEFVEKLLGDDPTAIAMFHKLVDNSDVLGRMFANEKIRKGCEMILGAKEEGILDVTWHVGGFPAMLMLFQPTKPASRRLLWKNRPLGGRAAAEQSSSLESSDRPESHEEEVGELAEQWAGDQETTLRSLLMPPPDRPSTGKGKGKRKDPTPSETTDTRALEGGSSPSGPVSRCSVCGQDTPPSSLTRYDCRYCRNVRYCSTLCLNFEITAHRSVCTGQRRPPKSRRKKKPKGPKREDPKGQNPQGEASKGHQPVESGLSEESSRFKCQLAWKPKAARVCSGCDVQEAALKKPLRLCITCERVYYCSVGCQRRHRKEHQTRCRKNKARFPGLWTYCCDGVHAANEYYRLKAPNDPKAQELAKKLPGLSNFGKIHPRFARCTVFMPPLWKLVGYGLDRPRELELFFGPTWRSLTSMQRESRLFLLLRFQCHKLANGGRVAADSAWKNLKLRSPDADEHKELKETQNIRQNLVFYAEAATSELRFLVDDVQEIIMPYGEDWPCSIQWFLSAAHAYQFGWASSATELATSNTVD